MGLLYHPDSSIATLAHQLLEKAIHVENNVMDSLSLSLLTEKIIYYFLSLLRQHNNNQQGTPPHHTCHSHQMQLKTSYHCSIKLESKMPSD
jgi:hypothetical protein